MRQVTTTADAPRSPLYSQAVRAAGLVFVSGTTGVDPATGQPAGPTIQEQTRQALTNCAAILTESGSSLGDAVDVGVLLADPADFPGMNEEWAAWFPENPPTRWVAQLGAVIPGIRISIRVTAIAGQ